MSEQKPRYEDAGEKIGGAAKDRYFTHDRSGRRVMKTEALADMPLIEQRGLTRDKLWPPLDFAKMRADGVHPNVARLIQYLRRHTPANAEKAARCATTAGVPSYSPGHQAALHQALEGRTPVQAWAQALIVARDAFAEVRTVDDLAAAAAAVTVRLNSSWALAGDFPNKGWLRHHLLGTPGDAEGFVSQNRHLLVPKSPEVAEQIWRTLDRTRTMSRRTDDEAKALLAERRRIESSIHAPHLDAVKRSGPDRRRYVGDVTAKELMDRFGFRAVEFGNWLPQGERAEVMNLAFDSFEDLSQVLNMPPASASFDGKLALAFGSRGQGGSSAARAHFDPARNLIHLTRLKGAGSLAHEWFHAYDFNMLGNGRDFGSANLAGRVRLRQIGEREFDAQQGAGTAADVFAFALKHDWQRHPADRIAERIERRVESLAQAIGVKDDDGRRILTTAVESLGAKSRVDYFTALAEIGRVVDEMGAAERCRWHSPGFAHAPGGSLPGAILSALAQDIRERGLFREVEQNGKSLPPLTPSDSELLEDAKVLEQAMGRGKRPYWSTTIEMFARAGERIVLDKLADMGIGNDYLVHPAKADEKPLFHAYPLAWDRERLTPLFDHMIAETLTAEREHHAEADVGISAILRLAASRSDPTP